MATTNQQEQQQLAGVVGFFESPAALLEATKKVREARFQHFDAFTPFPVHGLDHAMGIRRSPIPYVTFLAGLTGGVLGFLLQYWTSAVDWPLNVGGKPFNSWPAFVPVAYETTILFAALCTVAAMFIFNGLPNIKRRIIDPRITRDRFALLIEAPAKAEEDDEALRKKAVEYKAFSEKEAAEFLKNLGAQEVRSVYTEGWF